jgi:hypothetical protein
MEHIVMPTGHEPSSAGEKHIEKAPKPEAEDEGSIGQSRTENATATPPSMQETPLVNKLAAVLAPRIQQMIEDARAREAARDAVRVPQNVNVKRYAMPSANIPPPIGMAQAPAPAQPAAPQQAQPPQPQQNGLPSVNGKGGSPQSNPINSFGGISMSGAFNGNASLGTANAPGAKMAAQKCSCGCGQKVNECTCPASCSCRQKNGSCYGLKKQANNNEVLAWLMSLDNSNIPDPEDLDYDERMKSAGTPAWQRSAGKNEEGGLNAKGRASYNNATGGNLKAPVTESNPKGERDKRQNSFCSRMCGMKRVNTGAKTKKDPDSRINKSLRKWNCKCSAATLFKASLATYAQKQAGASMGRLLGTALASTGGGLLLGGYPGWKLQTASENAGNHEFVNFIAGKAPIALAGAVTAGIYNNLHDKYVEPPKKEPKPEPESVAKYLQYLVH